MGRLQRRPGEEPRCLKALRGGVQGLAEQVWLLRGHAVCSRLICSSHRPFSRNAQKSRIGPTVAWPICFPSFPFFFFLEQKKRVGTPPSREPRTGNRQTESALSLDCSPAQTARCAFNTFESDMWPAAVRFFFFCFRFPSFSYFIVAFCRAAFSSR